MFIAIGGPQAHVTLSMTDTLFQQPASLVCRTEKNLLVVLRFEPDCRRRVRLGRLSPRLQHLR